MKTGIWYSNNIDEVMETVEKVKDTFPCFISVEILELDWMEIIVEARNEDMVSIEREFSKFFKKNA